MQLQQQQQQHSQTNFLVCYENPGIIARVFLPLNKNYELHNTLLYTI